MIPLIRRLAATLFAAFAVAGPASATTFSTDFTDLWWNPAEDGWGVNVIQQYDTLFATLFVYGSDNSARWFVASDLRGSQTSFSGTLYQTSGPVFSGAFNPGAVGRTPVGSMTFTFDTSSTGTLTYTVNGATVVKSIRRQDIRNNNLTGNYLGGMTAIASSCGNSANNGAALINGDLTVAQSGMAVAMIIDWFPSGASTPARCTYNGTLTTQGRLGSMSGSFSCTGSATNAGNFSLSEVDASRNGFSAVFSGSDQFCSYNGRFGGLRDVI